MDWGLVIGAGFVLVVLIVMLPRLRDRYEKEYTDDREFLRDHRPRMWNLIGGITDSPGDNDEKGLPPGVCVECGTENSPEYDYCRACGGRLLPMED